MYTDQSYRASLYSSLQTKPTATTCYYKCYLYKWTAMYIIYSK